MNKKFIWILILASVVIIICGGVFVGWWLMFREVPDSQACKVNQKCAANGKCISGTCSTGITGASCAVKEDCKSNGFCVSGKCTEGIEGSSCATYKDCKGDLLCKNKACAVRPSYTKYFDKIEVSQMKPGSPPGPNNVPVPATTIKSGQSIEVDITNTKKSSGTFWVEMINQETGEKEWATDKQTISDSRGTGFQFNGLGVYDLNVYFNDELVYSVAITMI